MNCPSHGHADPRTEMLRIPPHSIDAEQSVLGALLLDERAVLKVADWLRAQDFYRRDHQLIYTGALRLSEASKPVDAVTLADWLDAEGLSDDSGGLPYLIDLGSTQASAANVLAYAEIVVEKSRLRQAIDVGTQLTNAAFDGKRPSADVLGIAQHALTELQGVSKVGGLAPVKPALKRMFNGLQERYDAGPGLLGIPTPWRHVNALTKGLRPGVLYVVAGRPSMGKSIFACQLAGFCAARGVRTGLFSAEMGEEEVLQRMAAGIGGVPHDWIEQPSKDAPDEDQNWARLTDAIAKLASAPLMIDETPAIRIEQLMARARREHMRSPMGLIVTDHLHDMGIDNKREARHELGRAVQGHKTLAKELGCPVVLFAQLNRNVAGRADKRPVMTDLRESGEIEQKSDVIFFLHREDYYDRDTHMKGAVELIPAKGRNLRIDGNILLANRFDVMRMDDWEGPWPTPPAVEKPEKRGWGKWRDRAQGERE